MKIILSPAKQMLREETLAPEGKPVYLEQARQLAAWMRTLRYEQAKRLWQCSERLAQENYSRLQQMDLDGFASPAILAYDGIAYKYMAPSVFEQGQFDYVQQNLRILSGLYGVLRPMDGVVSYRLEMQAKVAVAGTKDLYQFWGSRLYEAVRDDSGVILNLASREYARCIEPYLTPADTYITCVFAERENGKLVQKGVYAKMARGEMVRYMAVHNVRSPEQIQGFSELGYCFSPQDSDAAQYVFVRAKQTGKGRRNAP
ncbi:MAG: peroxide stress protein YaaA [Faecalibacterium sp.]